MNYKYEVGTSFPHKLLRKGETQSQVQSEKKAGSQTARGQSLSGKTKNTKQLGFVLYGMYSIYASQSKTLSKIV